MLLPGCEARCALALLRVERGLDGIALISRPAAAILRSALSTQLRTARGLGFSSQRAVREHLGPVFPRQNGRCCAYLSSFSVSAVRADLLHVHQSRHLLLLVRMLRPLTPRQPAASAPCLPYLPPSHNHTARAAPTHGTPLPFSPTSSSAGTAPAQGQHSAAQHSSETSPCTLCYLFCFPAATPSSLRSSIPPSTASASASSARRPRGSRLSSSRSPRWRREG